MIQSRAMANDPRTILRLFAAVSLLIFAFAMGAVAQPAGGKTSDTRPATETKSTPKTPTKSPGKSVSKGVTNPRPASNNGQPASLNGKWWTSGNDFGASEVVFTQNGASVSGVIHYADGRTGTIKGAMDFRANRLNWSSGFFWTWCGRN